MLFVITPEPHHRTTRCVTAAPNSLRFAFQLPGRMDIPAVNATATYALDAAETASTELTLISKTEEESIMFSYESMTDRELLGQLIGAKKGEQVTEQLLQDFPQLSYLLVEASVEELLKVKGMGLKRARQIKCCYELARRLYVKPYNSSVIIKCPADAANLIMQEMRFLKREQFRIVLLNTKNHVMEIKMVSEGSLTASIVHPREVFNLAVKRSASAVLLIHNHPSGEPEPSSEDIETTRRLISAGDVLGIKVLDHVIIGDGRFVSLKEKGLI